MLKKALTLQQVNQITTDSRFPIQTVRLVQQHFMQSKRSVSQGDTE